MENQNYAGIDIGSSSSKAVIIDDQGKILSSAVQKTGIHITDIASKVYQQALDQISNVDVKFIVSTGYGRRIVDFANKNITEITCTARGAFEIFPISSTVVDIGGQDNKVIAVGKDGSVQHFQLNRKCAAGTGTFLEEIAWKLEIPLNSMETLAKKGTLKRVLNSYCSVFAATEVLEQIRQGELLENMLLGVYHSISKRIFDMGQIRSPIVVSGGTIQYNLLIVDILREKGYEVKIPPTPQILPAFGAALLANDIYNKKQKQKSTIVLKTQ